MTPNPTIHTAIVGAGHIAHQHLACLRRMSGTDLVGVCDLSPVMAESTAERYGVKAHFTDFNRMLRRTNPQVVHITTPGHTHFALAKQALNTGAHVVVEKPITQTMKELETLFKIADARGLHLIEDHNYLFNREVQQVLELINQGQFGQIVHMDVMICLDILAPGSRFSDLNCPHPSLRSPAGAISDFLSHLAYLTHAFVGQHRTVQSIWRKRGDHPLVRFDELRSLVTAEHGTAMLMFSAHSQPDAFMLHLFGTRMQATINLFESRITTRRVRPAAATSALINGLDESRQMRRAVIRNAWRKFADGRGSYEGLWELLRRTYRALRSNRSMPVSFAQIESVNRLVHAVTKDVPAP